MKSKKVCMVVSTDFWNDRRVFKEATSVLKLGYTLKVICASRPEDSIFAPSDFQKLKLEKYGNKLEVKNVILGERKYRNIPVIGIIFALFWVFSGWIKFFLEIKKTKCDLYHFHDIDGLSMGYLAAKINQTPFIFDCHDIFSGIQIKNSILYKMRALWKWLEATLSKRADQVFTIAHSVESDLISRCGVEPNRITKVYNAPELYELTNQDLIRIDNGIPKDKKIVLYLGSVNPDRGLDALLEACKKFDDNLVLAIYGFGHKNTWEDLGKIVEEYDIADKVYLGHSIEASKVHYYLQSADFLTIPNVFLSSSYDVLPNKFFESMMAGKPFVCNFLPEMSSLVQEYQCGVVCDNSNPSSYADALNQLNNDTVLAGRLGCNGRKIAVDIHNWKVQAQKISKIYSELLS